MEELMKFIFTIIMWAGVGVIVFTPILAIFLPILIPLRLITGIKEARKGNISDAMNDEYDVYEETKWAGGHKE